MQGRPLGKRKRIQITIGLVILAWATQLLLHQWGYGAEVEPVPAILAEAPGAAAAAAARPPAAPPERFMPARPSAAGATIELRSEATVFGPEVRLKQICRWSNHDAAVFLPIAELVVLRFDGKAPYKSIGLDELKTTLADAKANIANIHFAGPLTCTVRRSEAEVDPKDALQQWIDSRQAAAPTTQPASALASRPLPNAAPTNTATATTPAPALAADRQVAARPAAPQAEGVSPLRTLRQLLTEDLGVRLNVPVDQLQINFNPKDERVLNLAEPQFRFNLEASRVRNLGDVEWSVTVVHDTGVKKVPVAATARAWQAQALVARPLSARQIIRAEDITERRTLADRLPDEPLLAPAQIVGQQAGRDLKPGTVITSRMVDAVPLARPGQYVTITVNQGGIRIKTAARAMEGGSFGQTIRVKNEATNEMFEVVLTGPQEGTIGGGASVAEAPKVAAAR